MDRDINQIIEEGYQLAKKHEQSTLDLFNNENVPQEFRDSIQKIHEEFKQIRILDEQYLEKNKDKKLLGYDPETFLPIFEK